MEGPLRQARRHDEAGDPASDRGRAAPGGLVGTPLLLQATLGNPNWPWQPIGEREVATALQEIGARGPRFVGLAGHDSTPWTYEAFAAAFGGRYRTLSVGEEIVISATAARPGPAG